MLTIEAVRQRLESDTRETIYFSNRNAELGKFNIVPKTKQIC